MRYVLTENEQQKILKACHLDSMSGHMGMKHTLSRMTERFMWPSVGKDVEQLVD